MELNKDKQIEEMARVICKCYYNGICSLDSKPCDLGCGDVIDAKKLYNAGYRKASEVAREIVTDLVKFADDNERQRLINGHSVWYIDSDDITDFIAELKKKYKEET